MMQHKHLPERNMQTMEPGWAFLYLLAGAGALIAVALMLLDFSLSFAGGDVHSGSYSAVEWFAFFQKSAFLGLRNLGLLNIINMVLTLPLYLALYQLHRRGAPAVSALALILIVIGAAVYIANNRALALLALSDQYADASGEAQKALLAAAGTTLLAQSEDFTPGAFPGFFLSSLGALLMMAGMLRGSIFRKWVALLGLVGTTALLIFTICVTFVPATFQVAMLLAMLGGLLMIVWNIRVGLAMFRAGRAGSGQEQNRRAPAAPLEQARAQ